MPKASNLHYLNNKDIDKNQWDKCINASMQRLIYGFSFYLDNMSAGWSALTGDNYDWVLPLTHRTKFGIKYLYQPSLTQQLGIFSKVGVNIPYKEIIEWLQQHIKFCEVNWNYAADVTMLPASVAYTPATNFVLDLSSGYEAIAGKYHNDLKKNLKRSGQFKLGYGSTNQYEQIIDKYSEQYSERLTNIAVEDYRNFASVCGHAAKNEMLVCRKVTNDDEVVTAAVLLNDGKRIYNIINVTTAEGRKVESNHFMFDALIKEFAGQGLLLDFEGSDVPGVRSFYRNFGGVDQQYYHVKYNSLPWLLRLIKK